MRRIPAIASIAAALAFSACATSGAQPTNQSSAPQSPVATKHPFEMKGKVESVSGGVLGVARNVTIARDQAPSAVLHVADETRITVDGKVTKLSDIRPGDDVRALFDFDGGTPIAIEIDAKTKH